ncbi:tetratricopeptide (TPR) repeat protein [Lewinella aquimaris]|uniref:Tetratricopeptide (TPR) repeat protein n=1 Tax=Neolewinella aquimaris TaxID=1835722 RepID=A0A840E423_9BACT|nr:SH3 domain-containing protein [Neolewinella aquimaris]MBB4078415.1 tetratricopeptide (TPR) repeat protein [Neolewinella aquimaris]
MRNRPIVFFLLLATSLCGAQDTYTLASAQQELEAADYLHAVEILDSIERTGVVSADFYHALGNARFESGQIGPAILAYERGLRLRPGNKDLLNNLRYVREEAGLTLPDIPDFFLLRWWKVAGAAMGTTTAYALSLVFWWLAVAGTVWWYLRRRQMEEKRRFALLPLSVIGMVLAATFFLLGRSRYAYLHATEEAVLTAPAATLRVSPTAAGSVEAELEAGHKVRIVDEVNRFVKVQLVDGRQGYLLRESLDII